MEVERFRVKGFVVWSICALFFLYEFLLRTVIGTFQVPLMRDLNLTTLHFSLLSTTIFFLVYGTMQIPAGLIVDNIGLKKAMLLGCLTCTVASFGFAYSNTFIYAIFFRLLMGFGASFGFISLLISVNDWMPHRHSALFIGLSQFIGTLGPMLAAGPLDAMSESAAVSWRYVFLCLTIFGAALVVLIFFFVENNIEKAGEYTILKKPEKIFTSLKKLCSRSQPWIIAFFCACLYFTIEYLSENEGKSFLLLKGISSNAASYMITFSWLGYAIGCPVWGYISDFFQRRKIVMILSAFLGLISISTILYLPTSYLVAAFICLGISASGQSVGFANIAEQFKHQFVAVGFGMNNGIITLISAFNAPFIGFLIDDIKKGSQITLSEYITVFNVLIALSVLALILSFFIKETFCKSKVSLTLLNPKKC